MQECDLSRMECHACIYSQLFGIPQLSFSNCENSQVFSLFLGLAWSYALDTSSIMRGLIMPNQVEATSQWSTTALTKMSLVGTFVIGHKSHKRGLYKHQQHNYAIEIEVFGQPLSYYEDSVILRLMKYNYSVHIMGSKQYIVWREVFKRDLFQLFGTSGDKTTPPVQPISMNIINGKAAVSPPMNAILYQGCR